MTQNVFGNNSRRKLDFKIGVVGEAFDQVRVNGLPAKFELFNQEGWSQQWHFLRYRKKWPWPIFGDHATMTIFAVSQNGHGQFWRSWSQKWQFLGVSQKMAMVDFWRSRNNDHFCGIAKMAMANFGDHDRMTIFRGIAKMAMAIFWRSRNNDHFCGIAKMAMASFWRSTLLIKKFDYCQETIHMYSCLLYVLDEKNWLPPTNPTRNWTTVFWNWKTNALGQGGPSLFKIQYFFVIV